MGKILMRGTPRSTNLIWGYAKGYSFDLGVRQYQKVENRWVKVRLDYFRLS